MKALLYHQFRGPVELADVPDPAPSADGAVIAVRATGICRSDWHGWQGHDADIRTLPHVPGHEFAGEVLAVGSDVLKWLPGDRVTTPFVAGCGKCPECVSGNQQVCDHQFQAGFTGWGSFAECVAVRYADENLVRLPGETSRSTPSACSRSDHRSSNPGFRMRARRDRRQKAGEADRISRSFLALGIQACLKSL